MTKGVLWDMADDELEQHLLRHGRSERAPDVTRRLVLATAVAMAGSGVATTSSAAGAVAVASRSGWWLVAKWLAVGASTGAVVMGAATALPLWRPGVSPPAVSLSHAVLAPPRAIQRTDAKRATAIGQAAEALVERPEAPSGAPGALPSARATSGSANRSPLTSASELPSGSTGAEHSLRAEVALLQQARRALDARDAERARAALSRYDLRFPTGRLRVEATAMRIETQFATGQRDAARAAARTFLIGNPRSPAALRVRGLLASSDRAFEKP